MLIDHTCRTCGHPSVWGSAHPQIQREREREGWPNMACGQGCHSGKRCDWAPPQIRRTWDKDGRLVERIHPPGEPWAAGLVACGCDACRELYEQQTAQSGAGAEAVA